MIVKKPTLKDCACTYKLILMDCNMPILNGYDACVELKRKMNEGIIRVTKVVACTADLSEDNNRKCKKAQFDEMLSKPIVYEEL